MALDPGVKQALDAIRYGIGHDWGVYNTFQFLSYTAGRCRTTGNSIIDLIKRNRLMY